MQNEIPCAVSVAEREHDRPNPSDPYYERALEEIVDSLLNEGVYPHSTPTLFLSEFVAEHLTESEQVDWLCEMASRWTIEQQCVAVNAVRDRLTERLKDKLWNHYEVGFLAQDYARQAEEDRRYDDE